MFLIEGMLYLKGGGEILIKGMFVRKRMLGQNFDKRNVLLKRMMYLDLNH